MAQLLAWMALLGLAAMLALTDSLLLHCTDDCSDSGGVQGTFLAFLLTPAAVVASRRLLRSGDARVRRVVRGLWITCAVLFAVLVFWWVDP